MSTLLNLSEDEDERLQQIANEITRNGNKTEAVRQLMSMYGDEDTVQSTLSGGAYQLEELKIKHVDEAREMAKKAPNSGAKTNIIASYLRNLEEDRLEERAVKKHIKWVLECSRSTAIDYKDRLEGRGYIEQDEDGDYIIN